MKREFRDWLEEKKRDSTYSYLNNGKLIIPSPNIEKELELVIKKYDELHKPVVIPKYVAEWIIRYRDKYDLYPALRLLENNTFVWGLIYEWYRTNTHKFVNAYLTGEYEVEVLSQEENINIVLNDLKEYIKEQQSLSQNVGLVHTSAGNDTHYRQYDFVLECIDEYEPSDELQNLLVPKQEELESKIKVLIEAYKQEDGAYSNPENGWISGFVEDLENLVEKEQKYYVDLDTAAYVAKLKYDGRVDIYTDSISGSDEYEFHLTEEEIKNYDERFWSFAKPVEELEE